MHCGSLKRYLILVKCSYHFLGLESSSDRILSKWKKGVENCRTKLFCSTMTLARLLPHSSQIFWRPSSGIFSCICRTYSPDMAASDFHLFSGIRRVWEDGGLQLRMNYICCCCRCVFRKGRKLVPCWN